MASKARQLAQSASAPEGRKNLLINGDMRVAQRSTSVTGQTAASLFGTVDRFASQISGPTSYDQAQVTDSPDGFTHSFKVTTNGAFSASAGHYVIPFDYRFEGQDLQHLVYGTSSAKTFTVSFHIKSTKTGTYVVEAFHFATDDTVRRQAHSYTINSANTWEKKTITFSGDTAKDVANNNLHKFGLFWWVAGGSSFTSGTLASSWENADNANRAVGVASSLSDDDSWQITGVQMEVGSVATEFEHRSFGEELDLCQRYYQSIDTAVNQAIGSGTRQTTNTVRFSIPTASVFRTSPSITTTGTVQCGESDGSTTSVTSISALTSPDGYVVATGTASGVVAGSISVNAFGGLIQLDAEL